jgi:hypothetical protein
MVDDWVTFSQQTCMNSLTYSEVENIDPLFFGPHCAMLSVLTFAMPMRISAAYLAATY